MKKFIVVAIIIVGLLVSVTSAPAQSPTSIYSETYYDNGVWKIWEDGRFMGFSYGEQNTWDLLQALNVTGGCQVVDCSEYNRTPCITYQAAVADHETWHVTKNYGTWITETNSYADALTMRNALRMVFPGGSCPVGGR